MRTFMVFLSVLCLPAGVVSIVMGSRASDTRFWSIGQENYGFDAGLLAQGSLIAIGVTSILLAGSGLLIISSPELVVRFFGSFFSLVLSIGLLAGGVSAVIQSYQLPSYIDQFCAGGFPDTAPITANYLQKLNSVETYYIQRHMCAPASCPCSPLIQPKLYGSRADELKNLDITNGLIDEFYKECYLPLLK